MDLLNALAAPVSALAGMPPLSGTVRGWLSRIRVSAAAPSTRLSSETAVRLGAHHTAHVLRLGNSRWLVVCHPGGATVLEKLGTVEDLSAATEVVGP